VKPPENVLFVCKLNPMTEDEDLQQIFSRFGPIVSCQIIRDKETGNSLGYAFIEFQEVGSCEEAYLKMDKVLIDDRRIHVDFSQSVSKLHSQWIQQRRRQLGLREETDRNSHRYEDRPRHEDRPRIDDRPRHDDRRDYRDHERHDHRNHHRRDRSRSRERHDFRR